MSWEIIFVSVLLVGAIVSFILERWPVDVTAIVVFAILLIVSAAAHSPKLPDLNQLLLVFSNSAPLTIAAMFILSAALDRCGIIDQIGTSMEGLTRLPYPLFVFSLVLAIGCVGAFINNTPVVVVLMPVVISLARKIDISASKLLIPLSYAAMFGGVCTLIGTSTNILVSEYLRERGHEPLAMFELTWVGVPLLLSGAVFLALFSRRLLPDRETLTSILSEEERKEFITEAFILPASPLVGISFHESNIGKERSLRLLEIIRDGVAVAGDITRIPFRAGDRLVIACRASTLAKARQMDGVQLVEEANMDLQQIAAHEGAIIEGVIGPRSSIVGKTIEEINFRQRYRLILLAVHRGGRNLREQLGTLRLDFGDTLLMMGTDQAIENLRKDDDIILLDRPPLPAQNLRSKRPLVAITSLGMVLAISFNLLPIVAASIIAVAIFLVSGVLSTKDAYKAVDWRILILIYGMLGLTQALETSGVTSMIASGLLSVSSQFPDAWRPMAMLMLVYLTTSLTTEFLSNNASALLIIPIALLVATNMGVDPRSYVIAVCVAASGSFATPISYQTNTYIYGVGGYRFTDFCRIGIPMNLVYFAVSMLVIPLVWPF